MTKCTITPYIPAHLEKIVPKEIHQGEMPKVVMNYAVTLMLHDDPIAILGGFLLVPGVLHIWAIMSEGIRKCPFSFQRSVLDLLTFYEITEKVRRIQVEVRTTYLEGQRWIESLGFEKEGIMRRYSPDGGDNILYSRLNKCQL